jgi:hypothetical protein
VITESRLKNTTLDDSAEIYQKREQLTEKQKLSNMTFKEKLVHFNSYYRMKTILIITLVALVVYFAYSILTPSPETVLYAAVVNNAVGDETAATLQTDFGKHLGINTNTQDILVDTSFYLGTEDNASEYTIANSQKLTTYIFAKEIDVIIAPESVFANYAVNGSLCKLSDQLPTDLCSTLADSFYYSSSTDNPKVSAYGIYLDNAALGNNNTDSQEKTVLGIVVNSKQKQNAVEFIRFLLKLY